ncbi:MAG: hypothetical protein LBG11_02600, partial [Bifidobacteriaceae bacterium]|nr:hypothetical protein [Bifidobacteriaceae bacterium]
MAKGFAQWGNDLYTGRRSYQVVPKIKVWLGVAVGVILVCVVLLFKPGLELGLEFVGGTEFRVSGTSSTEQGPALSAVRDVLGADASPQVTSLGDGGVRVQVQLAESKDEADQETQELRQALAEAYDVATTDVSNQMVSASWGSDVSSKALRGSIIFLVLVAVAMVIYFRNWAMAVSAITALIHDLVVTVGAY